jgi:hypothetical protein
VAYASYVDPAQVAAARRGVSPRPLSVPPAAAG